MIRLATAVGAFALLNPVICGAGEPVITEAGIVAALRAGADTVCMMGRFMGLVQDLQTFAPVLKTSAAYGGGWALPIVCRYLALTHQAAGADLPLMGTKGVRSAADVLRMALCGASAAEVLSIKMHAGFAGLTRVIIEMDAFLAERALTFHG